MLCSDIIPETSCLPRRPSLSFSTEHFLFSCCSLHWSLQASIKAPHSSPSTPSEDSPPSCLAGGSQVALGDLYLGTSYITVGTPPCPWLMHTSVLLNCLSPWKSNVIMISPLEPDSILAICSGPHLRFHFDWSPVGTYYKLSVHVSHCLNKL